MKIIGEKINGTRTSVKKAITGRDQAFIRDLARKQAQAGSAWLDINAGTHPGQEKDDLIWLINTVQAVVDIPLCLDSANPEALAAAIKVVNKIPMVNSISGEQDRLKRKGKVGSGWDIFFRDGETAIQVSEGYISVLE